MKLLIKADSFSIIAGGNIFDNSKVLLYRDPKDKMIRLEIKVKTNQRHSLKFSDEEMQAIVNAYKELK